LLDELLLCIEGGKVAIDDVVEKTIEFIESSKIALVTYQDQLDADNKSLKVHITEKEKIRVHNQTLDNLTQLTSKIELLDKDKENIKSKQDLINKLLHVEKTIPLAQNYQKSTLALKNKSQVIKTLTRDEALNTQQLMALNDDYMMVGDEKYQITLNDLQEQMILLQGYFKQFNEASELETTQALLKKAVDKTLVVLDEKKKNLQDKIEEENQLQSTIETVATVQEKVHILENKQSEMDQFLQALQVYKACEEKMLGCKIDYETQTLLLKKQMDDFDHVDRRYKEKKRLYFLNQAANLAEALELNEPCPVCGSLDHPSPASSSLDVVSEEDLSQLEGVLESKRKQKQEAQMAYTRSETSYKTSKEAVDQQGGLLVDQQILLEGKRVDEMMDQYENTCKLIGVEKKTLEDQLLTISKAKDDLKQVRTYINTLNDDILKLEKEVHTKTLDLKAVSVKVETAFQNIPEGLQSQQKLKDALMDIGQQQEEKLKFKERVMISYTGLKQVSIEVKSKLETEKETFKDLEGIVNEEKAKFEEALLSLFIFLNF